MQPVGLVALRAGDVLYEQGDHNTDAFVVASGEVVMFRTEQGKRYDCETRGRGAVLGGLSVLTNHPRYVGAQAVTDTIVFRVAASHILNDFDAISPLLRACVETSIAFNARLSSVSSDTAAAPPAATPKVKNADDLIERYKFEIDLLRSIAKSEFSMVYQPIVTLQTGDIVGFEALMRWCHPERGFVPPDQFITVAEDLGVIGSLTEFALVETCKTLNKIKGTRQSDRDFFASINISGHDVARPGFAAQLTDILSRHDIAPNLIKLEVTETAFVPDNEDVLDNLHGIQGLGCGLSIDDFGTGYSNLAHLKTMPLSALKIDRAFAGDAHCNRVSGSIVSMLVGLGTALNVDIVAEGVETEVDVKALSDLGCSLAQGFYFHRPANGQDLLGLLGAGPRNPELESVA
ncbi:EAL domain-containing protein [Pseudooctadecabacter sp.]|uniref:EAL domain-containing protein n=1 Tax=Pseudooctadecabacter sp. TaxID=1966338 RepID=UPI0025D20072|nr:EAL domain-containing protein [Pseudooctadecabacter sp.]